MVAAMDAHAFGNCSNHRVCEAVCPKEISIVNIARLNREFIKAGFASEAA
jgi:succinate dehydrogenase / fumarate reductase iron-sulfur subunit